MMCRESYCDFVSGFATLSPYELEHLSDNVLVKFEELLADRGDNAKLPLSIQDIKLGITRAMRTIQIEMAEHCMVDAQRKLEKARAETYTPRKVTEADIQQISSKAKLTTAK